MIFNELRLESYTFNKLATPPNISHTGSLLALDPVEMNNYYPFGMIKEGMFAKSGEGYRYGFNGMEKDDELNKRILVRKMFLLDLGAVSEVPPSDKVCLWLGANVMVDYPLAEARGVRKTKAALQAGWRQRVAVRWSARRAPRSSARSSS